MRKIYLTLAMLIGFGWAMAQTQELTIKNEVDQVSKQKMENVNQTVKKFRAERSIATKATESRWFGYGFELDNQLGNIATIGLNNVWPDSTILVNYSTGYSGPWIHAIGEAVNPKSSIFAAGGGLVINEFMPYTIDSIAFYCFYYRETATASAVDTLQIQILENGDGNYYWEQGASSWVMTNFGTDTLWFKGIKHDALVNYTTNPMYTTYKFPLTAGMENDTLPNGVNYFKFPINMSIAAGKTFVAGIQFIPGFTWTANVDTISNVNHLRFISYEENGDAGGAGTFPSYTKFDWNCSYILPESWMYNATSEAYAPSYAYTAPFGYEHHWIEFLLTANADNINEIANNNLSVSQNQPNPFNGTTNISYTLQERSDVSLNVYNVAGAKVMNMNVGSKNAGTHNLSINGSTLKAGIYYYTLTANGSTVTNKMIVY